MDIQKLIRSASEITKNLKEMPDNSLITVKGCKIVIPSRFLERGLAEISVDVTIAGMYAMIVDDTFFATSIVPAMMRITPTETNVLPINGEDHHVFSFAAGSVVIPSLDLVKAPFIIYSLYSEFISKGNIPWYFGYTELSKFLNLSKYHTGTNVGSQHEVTELIISMIARDPKDKTKPYRNSVKSLSDLLNNPPAFIALRNIQFGANNTINKLAGSHVHEGIASALVSPGERVERIEEMLR